MGESLTLMHGRTIWTYGTFLKQSIRMKPIRFEYKVWCFNLPLEYLFDFTVYEGKTACKSDSVTKYCVGYEAVLDIIHRLLKYLNDNAIPLQNAVESFLQPIHFV